VFIKQILPARKQVAPTVRGMKSEQAAFGERFRAALKAQGQSESPKEIADLLPRYGGTPVSAQAVSGWLTGKSVPRQANLRALAKMLRMDPHALQYGDTAGRHVREPPKAWKIAAADQLAIDAFLALPSQQRKAIRELIGPFAGASASRR
jgi:transcriptional regulator with XRE-family HTH domain